MKVLIPGHRYELDHIDGDGKTLLHFLTRFRGDDNREGPLCQEVLRALIDRVQVLDKEVRWSGNQDLLGHLRMALVHFEARALIRKVERGQLRPELLAVAEDGHWDYKF